MRDLVSSSAGGPDGSPLVGLEEQIRRQEELLARLRQEYVSRQVRLAELQRRREELVRQLDALDAEIRSVAGLPTPSVPAPPPAEVPLPTATPRPVQRRTSRPSLKDEIRFELSNSPAPLTDSRLAERILRRGYQTRSKDFTVVIRSAIHEMQDEVEHVREGYRLRTGAPL